MFGTKHYPLILVLILICSAASSLAQSQLPNSLNYQGVLTGTDNKPVADGSYRLTFKLYKAATGGTALWTETKNTTTSNGVFSVILGKVTSLANIPFDAPYWLGITVENGSEMTPRVELTASAYSLRSRSVADSSVSGASIANGQVIRNVNGIRDSVSIEAGSNVSIQKSAHKLTISSSGSGSSPWITDTNGITYSGGNVAIGAYPGSSALLVASQSGITTPQLRLHETTSGYARLNFDNGSGANNFWAIAGLTATTRSNERLNFYNHQTGDIMSISGDGRVRIGPDSKFETKEGGLSQLTVESHYRQAAYFSADSTPTNLNGVVDVENLSPLQHAIGVYSNINRSAYGVGVRGDAQGLGGVGVFGYANFGPTSLNGNYDYIGVKGLATGGTIGSVNYGVWASGNGGSATTNYAVYGQGDIAYTGSLIHVSDAKFKENVQPLKGVVNRLMQITPKSYTFRNGPPYEVMNFSSGKQYGVIAQEIEKVFPDLVVDAIDPGIDPNNPKDPGKPIHYKGVKYLQMIPILLEAIREQQQEIQQLKLEIEQLKK